MAWRMFVSHSYFVGVFGACYEKFIQAKRRRKKKRLSNQSVEKKGVECLFYKWERSGKRIKWSAGGVLDRDIIHNV